MSGMEGVRRDRSFYDSALIETARETAGAVGDDFFKKLVRSLARSFRVHKVFVAEFAGSGTKVKQLASWAGDAYVEPKEFDVTETPCRDVLAGRATHYEVGVAGLFPREIGFESYLGVPLQTDDGAVAGHLALLDRHPFEVLPSTWVVLDSFAARAAAD